MYAHLFCVRIPAIVRSRIIAPVIAALVAM
jgi:hypothetical protein